MPPFSPSSSVSQIALSATSLRLVATLQNSFGKDALKSDKLDRERRAAIAALIDAWLEAQDERARARAAFFTFLEVMASGPQRRRIATHPLRPAEVAAAVEAAIAKAVTEAKAVAEIEHAVDAAAKDTPRAAARTV